MYLELAQSVAAHVPMTSLSKTGGRVDLNGPALKDSELNVCPGERFAHQPYITKCSGVLVAPDVIATAGHCMMSPADCSEYAWVFNYKVRNARQKTVSVRNEDVYRCKKVVRQSMTSGKDFALVRLDRAVENARPVKVAARKPKIGDKLVTIGNPSGLPQKVADGGVVKRVSHTEFMATLDTFNFGSGSPVFDIATGEYIGILVRGQTDYVSHPSKDCMIPNVVSEDSGGEDISATMQFQRFIRDL
jgi:V8-like Glu-specific endopeptidase